MNWQKIGRASIDWDKVVAVNVYTPSPGSNRTNVAVFVGSVDEDSCFTFSGDDAKAALAIHKKVTGIELAWPEAEVAS